MSRQSQAVIAAVVPLLVAVTVILGFALHPLAVDDAFITYRYAFNLATGKQFTYNLSEPSLLVPSGSAGSAAGRPILSTTAPLYALILAAAALIWPDLPALANALSAAALGVAAILLFTLGYRERTPWVGVLAALLLAVNPLLWLSLGLETAVFSMLALAAILAYRSRHLYWAAILLALTTLTRGDGLILTAVLAADYALLWLARVRALPSSLAGAILAWAGSPKALQGRGLDPPRVQLGSARPSWREALGAVGVYLLVMLPLLLWLTLQFGSPLPATLRAKAAQVELGVTGFYPHTTYLEGLGILIQARLAQSWLYVLLLPAIAIGLIAMWPQGQWVRLIVAWGAAHLVGYTILAVTPYYWYYASLVPAVSCLSALGVVQGVRWLARWPWFRGSIGRGIARSLGVLWAVVLLATLIRSDQAMVQALDGPVPPPGDRVSKVLPEAKAGVYRQAGEWLREHTPSEAIVGVTEVGIMGYYAERPMVDFLGLLEPEVAEALSRGDLRWAMLHYQPDYLALTAISPLYAYDLRADPWFQAAYEPIQTFVAPRFWGSPLTVYRRRVARTTLPDLTADGLPHGAIRLDAVLGGEIRLLGAATAENAVQPGDLLGLTLYWQALRPVHHDYTVFAHLLGEHDRVIAQHDAAPDLGARPTSQWVEGQTVADRHPLALPETAYTPDQAVWEVGLYDLQTGRRLEQEGGSDNVRFGQVAILPSSEPLRLDFGSVVLAGYGLDRLALTPGGTLHLTLHWVQASETARLAEITVQMVGETGNVGAYVHRQLLLPLEGKDVYSLTLPADAPPGAYELEIFVADAVTGKRLLLLGADNQPRSDRARLTKVRLYP